MGRGDEICNWRSILTVHQLVRCDVFVSLVGTHFTRPLHAILLLVRHRAAVLARPLAELSGLVGFNAALVPIVAPLLAGTKRFLMLQTRFVVVEIPRRRSHELGNVGVDLVAILVDFRGSKTSLFMFSFCLFVWRG